MKETERPSTVTNNTHTHTHYKYIYMTMMNVIAGVELCLVAEPDDDRFRCSTFF